MMNSYNYQHASSMTGNKEDDNENKVDTADIALQQQGIGKTTGGRMGIEYDAIKMLSDEEIQRENDEVTNDKNENQESDDRRGIEMIAMKQTGDGGYEDCIDSEMVALSTTTLKNLKQETTTYQE